MQLPRMLLPPAKASCRAGLAALFLLLAAPSCKPGQQQQPAMPVATFTPLAPAFQADSTYQYLQQQLLFGSRIPGSLPHRQCGDWVVSKLKGWRAVVMEQVGQQQGPQGLIPIRNILASYYPTRPHRVLLCAHWDSRPMADQDSNKALQRKPVPGANDGASGVAVIMEVARQLNLQDPNLGVDLYLWDAEDMGQNNQEDSWCLGTQYWASHPYPAGYHPSYAILLDMVGGKGAEFTQEGYSREQAPQVLAKVWQTAHSLGYGAYFLFAQDSPVTDDHYYLNKAGIPTIDIIQRDLANGGFFPQHHTTHDDLSTISPETLKAVGQTVLELLFQEGKQRPK